MHYLKMLLYWPLTIVVTLLLYLCTYLPRSITDAYYKYLTRFWCRLFIRALGVDLQLIHKNKKPLPEQFILIANHPSSLEDFGMFACFDVYPLSKDGVRHWFFLGRIAERAGAIFFDRKDPASRHRAKNIMIDALKGGRNIVLFPEGGCHGKRIYTSFKTGAFDASLKTGLPIIPVFLHYEDQEAFEWLDPDILVQNFWQIITAKKHKANYYVYDAIEPEGFSDKLVYTDHVYSQYLEWQKIHLDGVSDENPTTID